LSGCGSKLPSASALACASDEASSGIPSQSSVTTELTSGKPTSWKTCWLFFTVLPFQVSVFHQISLCE